MAASNLTFGLPLRPGQIKASANSGFILPKPSRKASQFGSLTLQCTLHPRRQLRGRVITQQAKEGLAQVVDLTEFTTRFLQERELFLLLVREPADRQAESPSNLSGRCDDIFQRRWLGSHHRAGR